MDRLHSRGVKRGRGILLALAVLGALSAPKLGASELAQRYGSLPSIAQAQLSPDGNLLLTLVALQGAHQVGLRDLRTGEGRILLSTNGTDFRYQWCVFANATRVLCSFRKPSTIVAGTGSPYVGYTGNKVVRRHLMAVDVDGSNVQQLVPEARSRPGGDIVWNAVVQDRIIAWLPAEPDVVMIQLAREDQNWPSVYRLDIERNRLEKVRGHVSGLARWVASPDGTLRAGYGSVGGDFAAWVVEGTAVERVDLDALGVDTIPGSILAPPDEARLHMIGYGAEDHAQLLTWQPGATRLTPMPLEIGDAELTGLVTANETGELVGIRYEQAGERFHWLSPAFAAAQQRVSAAFADDDAIVQIVDADSRRRRFIVRAESPTRPPAYYLHDAPAGDGPGELRALAPLYAGVSVVHPWRYHRFEARDGLALYAWVTTPRGEDGPWPTVLLPHGGPWAHDSGGFDYWAQFLAARGMAVVQPNFRGSTGHGRALLEAGSGAWGREMQDDLLDALASLDARGVVDPGRVCIVGGSYGGYAALVAAYRDVEQLRCAVSFAGVSDLDRIETYFRRSLLRDSAAARLPPRRLRDAASPTENVAAVELPLLLIHGAEDRVVDVDHSRKFERALIAAGKTVRYVEQPNGDHHLSRQADRIAFLEELDAFLTEHLSLE